MIPEIQTVFQVLGVAAGAVILHHALAALNCMNCHTKHLVRASFILIAAGAFAQILDPWLPEDVASGADIFLSCGIALLLIADRRCAMCPRAMAIAADRRRRDAPKVEGERT